MSGLIWTPPGLALPAYPLDIDRANPLARDLVRVLQLGGSPSVERVTQAAITLTGGRPGGGPFGPARGLYSTFGGATSDRAAVALPAFSGKRSHLVIFYQNGGGGSTAGRLYDRASKERLNYTGVAGNPLYYGLVNTATGDIGVTFSGVATYGKRWNVFVGTADQPTVGGAVTFQAWLNGIAQALTVSGSASGTVGTDAGDLIIGNRNAGDRGWDGLIALVAVWGRVLTEGEALALSRDPGLIFRRPARLLHFPSGGLSAVWGDFAGAYALRASVFADLAPTYTLNSTASVSSDFSGAYALRAAVVADLSAAYSVGLPQIENPADRGTVDVAASTVSGSAPSPVITFKNRYIGDANTSGARGLFARVTGLAGLTPSFRVDRSNMEGGYNGKWYFSATGARGSWTAFSTQSSDASYFHFSHSAAFADAALYISRGYPWRVGDTLPWIESLEASGLIAEAPSSSGSGDYTFGQRSATTNGATSGAGDVIPAQPQHSARVGSGGTAPDGLPKRHLVMTSGVHAAEDIGNHCLAAAVDYLVSADAGATKLRQWFDVKFYPVVAGAGRAGGGQRCDFEAATKTADANRNWHNSTMECLTEHKAAIATDTGLIVDVFIDWHGTHLTNEGAYNYCAAASDISAWTAAIQTHRAGLEIRTQATTGSSVVWATASAIAPISVNPEYPYHAMSASVLADAQDFGADHMRAVVTLLESGYFGTVDVGADLAASYGIGGSVSADIAAGYAIRQAVGADLGGSYNVRQSVYADMGATYAVEQATTVHADLGASYAVRNSAGGNLAGAYAIRTQAHGDLSPGYVVRGSVSADRGVAYIIVGRVAADLACSYAVAGAAAPAPWRPPFTADRFAGPVGADRYGGSVTVDLR